MLRFHLLVTIFVTGFGFSRESLAQANDPLEQTLAFRRTQDSFINGDEKSCFGLKGIYGDDLAPEQEYRFSLLKDDEISGINSEFIKVIYRVETRNSSGAWREQGLLSFSGEKGWLMLKPEGPPPEDQGRGWRSLHLNLLRQLGISIQRGHPESGYTLSQASFDPDPFHGQLEGRKITLKALASIDDYLAQLPKNIFYLYDYVAGSSGLRVPPEIYEVARDPRRKELLDRFEFAEILDLIWGKALTLAQGDVTKALFISLLATDLRARGSCGSIYGRRGLLITPPSLFDGEQPSAVDPNRYDATEHFFGLALSRQLWGGVLVPRMDATKKKLDNAFPALRNATRDLHDDGQAYLDAGNVGDLAGFFFVGYLITGKYKADQRSTIDIQRDIFYDKLGSTFGTALLKNPAVRPSEVINSRRFNSAKILLGFKPPGSGLWQAYDPNRQVVHAVSRPPAKRVKVADEEVLTSAETLEEARVSLAQCQNSDDVHVRMMACQAYNNYLEKNVKELYERNKDPEYERILERKRKQSSRMPPGLPN